MTIDDRHEMNRGLLGGEYASIVDINRIYGPRLMSIFGITQEMLETKQGYARKRKFYYTTIHVIHAVRNGALSKRIERPEMEINMFAYLSTQFEKGTIGNAIDTMHWATKMPPPLFAT